MFKIYKEELSAAAVIKKLFWFYQKNFFDDAKKG